jgi:hypothetical protein
MNIESKIKKGEKKEKLRTNEKGETENEYWEQNYEWKLRAKRR